MSMTSPSSMQTTLLSLCSADPSVRMTAATEIYHLGRLRADHAVYPWWADQELSSLLLGPSPMVTIGVAVGRGLFEKIHEANGSPRLADVPPDQDAEEFELHVPGGTSVDVLTTKDTDGKGAIAKYLAKFGEGIQQVEFRCTDVDRATEILNEKFGIKAVYPETRAGADGARINFFLVTAPDEGKLLIELYEPAPRIE
ncbi:MAG: hypothetical protein PVS2B2_00680 [Candidatus Acidiferrum sp.]